MKIIFIYQTFFVIFKVDDTEKNTLADLIKKGKQITTYNFQEGTKVKGIVRETEKNKNGIFVELTPNLVGMADYKENLQYGQTVNVYIKRIIPEKKKVKLVII